MSSLQSPTARPRLAWVTRTEPLLLVVCLFWALLANRPFVAAALRGRDMQAPQTWLFGAALLVMLVCLHYLVVAPFAWGRLIKPLLALLLVVVASASYFMQTFGVVLDPGMLRNVLHTDVAESRELLSLRLFTHLLLYAGLPLLLLWRVRLQPRPWVRTLAWRLGSPAAVGTDAQPARTALPGHAGQLLWSLGVVVATGTRVAAMPRQVIGEDARAGPRLATRTRPLLVVLVVGETARAANWGLNGYARQTTPQLAQRPVISFAHVTSCGTNTEVSLPCMFAPVGRRDYDEGRVRGSQSLLHVLARAGVGVIGATTRAAARACAKACPCRSGPTRSAGPVPDGRCLDEGLLAGLPERLARASGKPGSQLLVLHMLGNHGPSYFRRYPPAFAQFKPACQQDDLRRCSQPEIVNAYDNALLYTDHVLARLIDSCRPARSRSTGAALRLGPWRIAGREGPVPARPALRHRTGRADAGADVDVVLARSEGCGPPGSGLPAPACPGPCDARPSLPHPARPPGCEDPDLRAELGPAAGMPHLVIASGHPQRPLWQRHADWPSAWPCWVLCAVAARSMAGRPVVAR
jgi:lipid A ethanolaminephosphotransferase